MILYHGTNNPHAVYNNPTMYNSVNGLGFYMTNDVNIARRYGHSVVMFELPDSFCVDIVRPIDQSYNEGIATYTDCATNGLEFVITKQQTLVRMLCELEDIAIIK